MPGLAGQVPDRPRQERPRLPGDVDDAGERREVLIPGHLVHRVVVLAA